jgi:thermopsin
MSRNRFSLFWVVGSVALMIAAGFGVLAMVPSAVAPAHPAASAMGASPSAPRNGYSSASLPSIAQSSSLNLAGDPASAAAQAAVAAAKAAGVKTRDVFVPRPSATPSELARAASADLVAPLYTGTPAPLGVADFGLSAGPLGSVVPSIVSTTSLEGTVNTTPAGLWGGDLFQSSPDSFGIQLNAVTTNVTLFGHGGYQFWTQNVVEFYPAGGFMVLVTNVWNFSSTAVSLSPNAFYAHGPYGHQVGTTFYYAELVLPVDLSYPMSITLTMTSNTTFNASTGAARDSVYFTVGLTGPSVTAAFAGPLSVTYDYVVFNSAPAANPHKVVAASNYTANGFAYNPVGLTDDFELILGGPGGGSHVDLTSADLTMGLDYWNGSAYAPVPSAFNYGGETGETASGVTIGWSNASGGPAGFPTYATVREGPTILEGLWNTTTPNGTQPVAFNVTPSNAFIVLSPRDHSNFTVPEASAAAGALGTTFYLPPGDYRATVELSDFTNVTVNVTVDDVPVTVNVTLTSDPSAGIYTPLWATSNAQLAAISSGGNGTPNHPYLLFGGTSSSLGPVFGAYNDFTFPVYPGVFLWNTNASVEIVHEPSITAATNDFAFPGRYLPSSNSLQWWFWNVSHVVVANTTFQGGWFTSNVFSPVSFDSFNVVLYASSDDLLWNDTFATPSEGLLMFQGGTLFGPASGGGGGNVVWGSTFYQTAPAFTCPHYPTCEPILPYALGLGLTVAEGNDTVVNNWMGNPTTAWQMPVNMYSGSPSFFVDRFNITTGATLPTLPDFPGFPFSGPNILGGAEQGGNFWWDYGSTFNPFNGAVNPLGELPYTENTTTLLAQVLGCSPYYCASYLYSGDGAPLTSGLVVETFAASGVPRYAPWGLLLNLSSDPKLPFIGGVAGVGGGPAIPLLLAPGTYAFTSVPGQILHTAGTVMVSTGGSVAVVLSTAAGYGYLYFHESGLPHSGPAWGAFPFTVPVWSTSVETFPGFFQTASSNLTVIGWLLPQGTYSYAIPGVPNFYPAAPHGQVTVHSAGNVPVKFLRQSYSVAFTESGLPVGHPWSVVVTGTPVGLGHTKRFAGHSTSSTITLALPNGSYTFQVRPVRGFVLNGTGTGAFPVAGVALDRNVTFAPFRYTVTFTESGLPASTFWQVTMNAVTLGSSSSTIVFYETNGTYAFVIDAVAGYSSTARPTSAHVAGAPVAVAVSFT